MHVESTGLVGLSRGESTPPSKLAGLDSVNTDMRLANTNKIGWADGLGHGVVDVNRVNGHQTGRRSQLL